MSENVQAMAGLKVLDLAWVVAGPLFGRALADFGATVVRVESSQRIETARMMGPFPGGTVNPQQSGDDPHWVAIAVRNDREWQRLAELIGGPGLANDPRFASLAERQANEDALEALVNAWTTPQTAAQIEQALLAIGVPVHKAASSADMAVDPQLTHRHHFIELPHALMGQCTVENARYLLSDTPAATPRSAPTFGRDAPQVLRDFAGYSAEKIAALADAGLLR